MSSDDGWHQSISLPRADGAFGLCTVAWNATDCAFHVARSWWLDSPPSMGYVAASCRALVLTSGAQLACLIIPSGENGANRRGQVGGHNGTIMDDWGDPWADNSSKKLEQQRVDAPVTKHANVLFGFEDDAGWGVEDADRASFEPFEQIENPTVDSSITTQNPVISTEHQAQHIERADEAAHHEKTTDSQQWESFESNWTNGGWHDESGHTTEGWDLNTDENVVAADAIRSDSEATVKDGGAGYATAVHVESPIKRQDSGITNTDDDASRTSTSPSSPGHAEDQYRESPRTSFEDDSDTPKTTEQGVPSLSVDTSATSQDDEVDDFGDFAEETPVDAAGEQVALPQENRGDSAPSHSPVVQSKTETQASCERRQLSNIVIDLSLVSKIFSTSAFDSRAERHSFPSDQEVISSTSARKAWYRITRSQTMREYNQGETEGYVRVRYRGSAVQSEMNSIVTHWAEEDRNRGRIVFGARAGPMFGWTDTPQSPSPLQVEFNQRKRASYSQRKIKSRASGQIKSAPEKTHSRQSSILTATDTVAQFSWSSPVDPSLPTSTGKAETAKIQPSTLEGLSPPSKEELDDMLGLGDSKPSTVAVGESIVNEPPLGRGEMPEEPVDEPTAEKPKSTSLVEERKRALFEPAKTSVPPRFPPVRQTMGNRISSFGSLSKNVESRVVSEAQFLEHSQTPNLDGMGRSSSADGTPSEDDHTESQSKEPLPANQGSSTATVPLPILETSDRVEPGVEAGTEDDWGDMVSSPPLVSPTPVSPTPTQFPRRTSSDTFAMTFSDADMSLFETKLAPATLKHSHRKTQSLASPVASESSPLPQLGAILETPPKVSSTSHTRIRSVPIAIMSPSLSIKTSPTQGLQHIQPTSPAIQTPQTTSEGEITKFLEGMPDLSFMLL